MPCVETLDPRRLFASVSLAREGKILSVLGTSGHDTINIGIAGRFGASLVVQANGVEQRFNARKVRTIRVEAGSGNDSIISSPLSGVRLSVNAGPGNDRIGGSGSDDTLFGQAGDDTLVGNGGQDYMDAGPDDDLLVDREYGISDVFHGGGGFDRAEIGYDKFGSGVEQVFNEAVFFGNFLRTAEVTDVGGRLTLSLIEQVSDRSRVEFGGPVLQPDGSASILYRFLEDGGGINDVFRFGSLDVTSARGRPLLYYRLQGIDDLLIDVKPILLLLRA